MSDNSEYAAQPVQVPANISSPEKAIMLSQEKNAELNAVNNLSGGRGRTYRKSIYYMRRASSKKVRKHSRKLKNRSNKSRHSSRHQNKGIRKIYYGGEGESDGQTGGIVVPQATTTCSSGANCPGAQNAELISISNQTKANAVNDKYAGGGRGKGRGKGRKTRRG
jgi:hypothetical protein